MLKRFHVIKLSNKQIKLKKKKKKKLTLRATFTSPTISCWYHYPCVVD